MNSNFLEIFRNPKPIIGMVHLDYLEGSSYQGIPKVVRKATADIHALQTGGIDGILIENWKENSIGEFVSTQTANRMLKVVGELQEIIKVPFGINVLNNDYRIAFKIAKLVHANFVQLDVFVDKVISDFQFNIKAKINPFQININPAYVWEYVKSINADNIPLIIFVHPKHYKLLNPKKTLLESIIHAINHGVSGVIITKSTGIAPDRNVLFQVKTNCSNIPIGIGSGIKPGNVIKLLTIADFAIVGSALKIDNNVDNPVAEFNVRKLMTKVNTFRSAKSIRI
jgi:uncharacterized protein